jgi:VWFA-related protein
MKRQRDTLARTGLRSRAAGVIIAAALTASAAPRFSGDATARSFAPQNPPQPTFRTEANYVRVDAYPTNNDGTAVTDLGQRDFEIVENGVPQTIEQFERVLIQGNLPQEMRGEPNSVEAGRQAAQNSRARVFVVFLDIGHVGVEGSRNIRQPLVDALDHLIGADDVFAVMTPEMSATDITFARKTTTVEGMLARYWTWGERNEPIGRDPQEQQYAICYPGGIPMDCGDGSTSDDRGIADAMIERRREKMTLDALTDLVRYLRGVREERKAVLVISDGWRVFRQDDSLARRRVSCQAPAPPQVGVDPRTGRLTGRTPPTLLGGSNPDSCERDRIALSAQDDEPVFRALLDEANRANTSFYPVDPRGLVAFDEPIAKPTIGLPARGTPTVTPPSVDSARLGERLTSLRTLAENTDGLAIVSSNDLARGFKRVVDDLSSYYLLGYYSTGKLDGRFHPISVRVKRPGVRVRARRGYLAATPAALTAATRGRGAASASASAPVDIAAEAEAHAIDAAVGPLAGYAREVPLRLQYATGWKPGADSSAGIWVVGEIGGVAVVGDAWSGGFEATATLTTTADATVASGRVTVPRGARTFRLALTPSGPIEPGDYVLRVGARADAAASIPPRETARFRIPPPPESTGAIFVRRGLSTGNRDVATADLRFRRGEQIRVEIPGGSSGEVTARLLDRTGKPLAVPVTTAARVDADGSRWQTAQLALAPLAPGDYVIEIASGDRRSISAFRVVP